MVLENEIAALVSLLNQLVNTSIDGVIVQDLGLFYLLSTYFKSIQIHASTQLTTHNEGQIRFLAHLNASRVNLSRELNLQEIKALTAVAHQNQVLTEVFVHGSSCLSFSGICYMSSVHGANSGNRGRCSQPCRDQYLTTLAGKDFPLNLKDNSAWFELAGLADAGVDSIKIEGRVKKSHYVFTVTAAWREYLQSFYQESEQLKDNSNLYQVFNRDFTSAYLKGDRQAAMFIDNPRDHSAIHRAELLGGLSDEYIEQAKQEQHDEKMEIKRQVQNQIEQLSIAKAPLLIRVSGESGEPLKVEVRTPDSSLELFSEQNLENSGTEVLNYAMLFKRLKAINDTEYYIEELSLNELPGDLYLPFKELTSIKRKLLFFLNNSREFIDPIAIPVLKTQAAVAESPTLFVLISKSEDVDLCNETSAYICFLLPNALKNELGELTNLFLKSRKLIPWFPSVLIGEDFTSAVNFLQEVKPALMVTDNSGVAFEAYQRGIPWIAGPFLNTANSFSLLCLKEKFNCSGAFISNEISKNQLQKIRRPAGFKLYSSIYHPILLMTSRQCLFHQLTGCEKNRMDDSCICNCEKSTSLTNVKGVNFFVEKSRGNFNRIWCASNLLNTDIVADIPCFFSGFSVDLRDIKTETNAEMDKTSIIRLFENYLLGNSDSANELYRNISPTTNIQYKKGV